MNVKLKIEIMRKLIEGSEEQFKNLVKLLESSGEDLPKIKEYLKTLIDMADI